MKRTSLKITDDKKNQTSIYILKSILILAGLSFGSTLQAQQRVASDDTKDSITVVAGRQYGRSSFHQWLWGTHYRRDWTIPVRVTKIYLDTAGGGLTPYQAGGGRQSKTLRLRNEAKKEYVLRSIDKSFGKALPELYQGTFIESILNDQVSIAEPYSAVTVAPMAEKAGVLHTEPIIGYLPEQPRLDSFNKEFGNTLYMFEQRPDENWEEAANLGNSKNITSTEKLFEKLEENNENQVDQEAYIKARLFDMFLGDWGRHEDQWRWASYENGEKKIYKPIPRDRDQIYTKFDGVLLRMGIKMAKLEFAQTFENDIKKVPKFNFPARNLDRRMSNQTTREQWITAARQLQESLTDPVIDEAVRRLPREVYKISGAEIASKLKARRGHLEDWATHYYSFLSKEPEVVGSKGNEYFSIKRPDDHLTVIDVYDISKEGTIDKEPFYHREFKGNETNEVRLYGLGGNDIYNIQGGGDNGIKVRIIGGRDKDSIVDAAGSGKNVVVYDNPGNVIRNEGALRIHLSSDSAINRYQYNDFLFDRKGAKFSFFYSNADRFYLSVGYEVVAHKWRHDPYYFKQGIYARYSLTQQAFNVLYTGSFYEFIGKWNLNVNAGYDFLNWINFAGIGNETKMPVTDLDFYRMRSMEFTGSIGLSRQLGKHSTIGVSGAAQTIKILDNPDRFIENSIYGLTPHLKEQQYLAGGSVDYSYQSLNDPIVPTRGLTFLGSAAFTQNLKRSENSFGTFSGTLRLYIPLIDKFSLAIYSGAATVTGSPEFYQLATIGGSRNLRGFRRERFWGQTAVFNSNELRWITNFKTYVMNGKFGLIALFDDGRVWADGEQSNVWHTAYGGGILLAPFNKFMGSVTYGISNDQSLIHVRFTKPL